MLLLAAGGVAAGRRRVAWLADCWRRIAQRYRADDEELAAGLLAASEAAVLRAGLGLAAAEGARSLPLRVPSGGR